MATKHHSEVKPHGLKPGSRVREKATGHTGKMIGLRATLRGEYADIELTKDDGGVYFKPARKKSVRPSALVKF